MSAGRALLVEIACIATCVAVGAILAAADPLSAPTAAVGRQRVAMALGHTASAAAAAVTAAAHAGGALLGSAAAECAAAVASRPVAFAVVAVACGAVCGALARHNIALIAAQKWSVASTKNSFRFAMSCICWVLPVPLGIRICASETTRFLSATNGC